MIIFFHACLPEGHIHFNKPGDPDFNPSPQTSSRSFKNPVDLDDHEFERQFGLAIQYLEEFAKKSNSGMNANDIFLNFRMMLLESSAERREDLCLLAEESPADCLAEVAKYKVNRERAQQAHTVNGAQDGDLFKSDLQSTDELAGSQPEVDITPAYRSNWINLRQGDIAKGTGLEAHILDNLEAFKAGWPQLDSEVQEELGKKFQQFYGRPLPFLQTSGSAPAPKKDNHAIRALALQYRRDWPQLWKDGAKNKGIDYKLRIAEMTGEQCRIMVDEVEQLIEMKRRYDDGEQF